ncbi:hypothetical protein AAFF_G00232020 [Aldrovandia affinis]|uniref:SH3 domain-containing protein n=1 Tax=Aldrovandia affinis TaxID=143900 RepID=A0AAD7RF78_9TELE|nr:hypothetical protein AAFF_G00232020 [Aldrovandia affinis]
MTTLANKVLVLVEFEYEYTTRDGGLVSIKPNERYILVFKTNDHWWHVRKDEHTKPFYIPAKYVKELPEDFSPPLDLTRPNGLTTTESLNNNFPIDLLDKTPDEVTIRVRSLSSSTKKVENRMSTFGIPQDLQDLNRCGPAGSVIMQQPLSFSKEVSQHTKRYSLAPSILLGSRSAADELRRSFEPPELPGTLDLREKADSTQDSENIYESIPEVQDLSSQDTPVASRVLAPAPPSVPIPSPVEASPVDPTPIPSPPPSGQVQSNTCREYF